MCARNGKSINIEIHNKQIGFNCIKSNSLKLIRGIECQLIDNLDSVAKCISPAASYTEHTCSAHTHTQTHTTNKKGERDGERKDKSGIFFDTCICVLQVLVYVQWQMVGKQAHRKPAFPLTSWFCLLRKQVFSFHLCNSIIQLLSHHALKSLLCMRYDTSLHEMYGDNWFEVMVY